MITGTLEKTGERPLERGGYVYDEVKRRQRQAWQNCFRVTLRDIERGGEYSFDYFAGCGITEITIADVLSSVVMDCQSYEHAESVGDFAREFGYSDIDETLRIWDALRDEARNMRALIGTEAYLRMLAADDPEEYAAQVCEPIVYRVNKRHGKWTKRTAEAS